jgi:hypothetical protein
MTDQELKDLVASLAVESRETDRIAKETSLSVKETGYQLKELKDDLKELARRMGGIDDNQGYHAEQYFQNAFAEKPVFGGIKYDEMVPNLAYKNIDGEIEFDIALVNGDSIALIEVKNRIHPKYVKELAEERVKKFKKYFPMFSKYKTRLGIAGFSFGKKVIEEAKKYGIGLIRQVGDSVEIKAKRLKVY